MDPEVTPRDESATARPFLAAGSCPEPTKERHIMRIVVIGGTGLIGSKVVDGLTEHGHDAVAAAPSTGVNTITAEGLSEVLTGTDAVIDVSNSPTLDGAAIPFFKAATTNLLEAEAAAGVTHHVALSVVGTARLAKQSEYFEAKRLQEELISSGPIPYTIVHATQFFEFISTIADSAEVEGTIRLPNAFIQPMASADVAEAVAIAAVSDPVNGTVEVGGPERIRMPELIRTALTARGDSRDVVMDASAAYWGVQIDETTLVPGDGATLFDIRFADWVSEAAAKA
jgi:uncharacterized protein YbjT (DUF2867 family)